nr:MAG TPA: hypothetical protein [Caudoviricetes sp.]
MHIIYLCILYTFYIFNPIQPRAPPIFINLAATP